jgi:hypothetical protein
MIDFARVHEINME